MYTGKSTILANLKKSICDHYIPWQIGYVDENIIYFSAYKYDQKKSVGKQDHHSFIYQFDRNSRKIKKINIKNCGSSYFSVYDDKIYFSDKNYEIYEFVNGITKPLGIKGNYPSISPNGKKIAFTLFRLVNEHVYLYEIKTKKQISVINFFGSRTINPIIKWSKDSNLIAVKAESDLRLLPLYIVNTMDKQIIYKSERTRMCNWFFVDGWKGERVDKYKTQNGGILH